MGLTRIISLILLYTSIVSCSAQYHFEKAISKDPSIVDTVYKDTLLEVEIRYEDSVVVEQDTTYIDTSDLDRGFDTERFRIEKVPEVGLRLIERKQVYNVSGVSKKEVDFTYPHIHVEPPDYSKSFFENLFYWSGILFWISLSMFLLFVLIKSKLK